jgi:hypothetical protein
VCSPNQSESWLNVALNPVFGAADRPTKWKLDFWTRAPHPDTGRLTAARKRTWYSLRRAGVMWLNLSGAPTWILARASPEIAPSSICGTSKQQRVPPQIEQAL